MLPGTLKTRLGVNGLEYQTSCRRCGTLFFSPQLPYKGSSVYCSDECLKLAEKARQTKYRRDKASKPQLRYIVPIKKAAKLLGIALPQLHEMSYDGRLPKTIRIGVGRKGVLCFLKSDLERFLNHVV